MLSKLFKKRSVETEELATITLQIRGMHCSSCAINIDFELEDLHGVKEAKTHYAKQISTIIFQPQQITHKELTAAITKLGYEVETPEKENRHDA
jgi:copper chaperone CopZ